MGNQTQKPSFEHRDRIHLKAEPQIRKAIELANQHGINEKIALEIASMNVWQLIQKLNSRQLSSIQILLSLILRVTKIGKEYCLYTETNFDYAIQMALKYDQVRANSNKANWTIGSGPFNPDLHFPCLFGIPISIKDTFDMEGFSTTVGLANRVDKKFKQSSLIACLKNSGAIPFIRSNSPQFGMAPETINPLWGRSLNPWNKDRSVGGSSGGQAGLIASRCSVLGMGSDIGGSIRIPAQFCGLFALKSYSKRISASYHTKLSNAFSGYANTIPLCLGPLAKSPLDLAYFMKVATTQSLYGTEIDPYVKVVEFNDQEFLSYMKNQNKLRIGIFSSLSDMQPTTASQRALRQVASILSQSGHECFQIKIPNERQIIRQFFRQSLGTGGRTFREILQNQDNIPQYDTLFQTTEMPALLRPLVSCFSSIKMPRLYYYFFQRGGNMSGYQYQEHIGQIQSLKAQWIDYWKSQGLNFVICPGFGCQAFLHGNSEKTSLSVAYTFIWNVLDMVAGSVPVTIVQQNQQTYQTVHNDLISDDLRKNAQNSAGLPVGIQVIGLPYQQQKVLGLMTFLQNKIKFYQRHPLPNLV